jgi:hypothetical protein
MPMTIEEENTEKGKKIRGAGNYQGKGGKIYSKGEGKGNTIF